MLHDGTDTLITDKFANLVVGYRAYRTDRGHLMLTIHVNGEKRYELGPFTSKEQRQQLLDNLRSSITKFGGDHERKW